MSFRLEYWEITLSCELAKGNNFSNDREKQVICWSKRVCVRSSMMATCSHDLQKTRRSAQTLTIPVLRKVLAVYPQTKDAQPEGDPPTKVISEGRGDSKHHQTDWSGHMIIFHQPFTNLDIFPWNHGDVIWGEVVWGRYNWTRWIKHHELICHQIAIISWSLHHDIFPRPWPSVVLWPWDWTFRKERALVFVVHHTHSIHVWYIYLHLVDFCGKCW